jgi:hypothetical protein
MPLGRLIVFAFGAFLLSADASVAGPCSSELVTTQGQIDAYLEERALSGVWTRESGRALMHRQPTPATIAAAEERLGEVGASDFEALERAMTLARDYDSVGDPSLCKNALLDVERVICSLRPGGASACPRLGG